MELKFEIADLQKRKLFVATPMFGGKCEGLYCKATADLSALCTHYGISLQLYYLFNESLIPRARNYCVDEFMRSDATHLLFIDGDISFNPQDVLAMLGMMSDDSPYDILTALYPKKSISWEKIKAAVDKGVADHNPQELDNYVGDYVFNPITTQSQIPLNEPAEVLEAGTGFMMIRRKTFEVFAENYPQGWYLPDHARTEHFDGSREIMQYFQAEIDPKSRRYLSEDYFFCQKVREFGLKTWACPWMRLSHVGTHIFGGSLAHLASIQVSPTVGEEYYKTKKKGVPETKPTTSKKSKGKR